MVTGLYLVRSLFSCDYLDVDILHRLVGMYLQIDIYIISGEVFRKVIIIRHTLLGNA